MTEKELEAYERGKKAGIDEAVEIIKDYEERMSNMHNKMIGNSHEYSKIMLAFDMYSRLIATKHILKALQDKK